MWRCVSSVTWTVAQHPRGLSPFTCPLCQDGHAGPCGLHRPLHCASPGPWGLLPTLASCPPWEEWPQAQGAPGIAPGTGWGGVRVQPPVRLRGSQSAQGPPPPASAGRRALAGPPAAPPPSPRLMASWECFPASPFCHLCQRRVGTAAGSRRPSRRATRLGVTTGTRGVTRWLCTHLGSRGLSRS